MLLVGGTRAFGITKIIVWRPRPPKTWKIPIIFGLRVPRNTTKQVLSKPPTHKTSVIAILFGSGASAYILNAPMSVSLYRFHLLLVPQKKPLPESSDGAAPKSSPPLNIDERRPRKLYTSGAQLRPRASNIRLEWPRRNARSDNNFLTSNEPCFELRVQRRRPSETSLWSSARLQHLCCVIPHGNWLTMWRIEMVETF